MASNTLRNTESPKDKQPHLAEDETRSASLFSIAWKQFIKHPMARTSLVILGVLYFLAAFADFFAPYPERFLDAYATFQPPNQIHWTDEGKFVGPYIYKMTKSIDLETFKEVWTADTSTRYPIKFFVTTDNVREKYVPFPLSLIPVPLRNQLGIKPFASLRLFGVDDPTGNAKLYLWGSDDVGSDVYSKVLFGSRISLSIGIVAAFVSIAIGMFMGGLAGFYGGWVDEVILRFVEVLDAIPGLFLLIALSATFYPLNLPSSTLFLLIIITLSAISWGGIARTVRGQVLSLKQRDFTSAAQALGASNLRVIIKHLLPNTLSFVIVAISLTVPGLILTEAVLSFFGLGIQPPATSWGLMLSTAQAFAGVTGLTERWWIFIPGLFIFIAVLTWNLLGDGLRDAFDPRNRQ